MVDLIGQNPLLLFPMFFVLLWLTIAAVIGPTTGWYSLMERYPNRQEENLLQLRRKSGMLGKGSMRGMLNLAVCPSGLRIGVSKIFGIFIRDFFVPWNEIRVTRKDSVLFMGPVAELTFGDPEVGRLRVSARTADRLARSAMGRWPE